jgi:nucleotide-binding universal stress UspA family protein
MSNSSTLSSLRSIVIGTDGSPSAAAAVRRGAEVARGSGARVEVETHAREGDPADVIIRVAEELGAELIVVGSRGLTGLERFLLGSVSSKLSQHAPTSLMVVRDD